MHSALFMVCLSFDELIAVFPICLQIIEPAIMPVAAFECFADVLPDPIGMER